MTLTHPTTPPGYDKLLEIQDKEYVAEPENEEVKKVTSDMSDKERKDIMINNMKIMFGLELTKEEEELFRNSPLLDEDFFDKYSDDTKHYEGPLSDTNYDWVPTEYQELFIKIYSKADGMSREEYLESNKKYHPELSNSFCIGEIVFPNE